MRVICVDVFAHASLMICWNYGISRTLCDFWGKHREMHIWHYIFCVFYFITSKMSREETENMKIYFSCVYKKKLLLSIFGKFRLLSAVRQTNVQKCFWFKCRDFHGFVYIRVKTHCTCLGMWPQTLIRTQADWNTNACLCMHILKLWLKWCLQGQWYVMSSACPVKLACSRIHKSTAQWSAVQWKLALTALR